MQSEWVLMAPYTTRIAPSPTGMMHIGTARTALFNWLVARATGGRFLLRMDDTDADRNMPEAEQPIFDGLTWLGLDWDEFHRQSERIDIYRIHAGRLLDAGLAFRADNGAIVLRWQSRWPRIWKDEIGGERAITDQMVEQIDGRLILVRGGGKLGQATYQFASIVDDYLMGVDFIIRGVDHVENTGKQVAIWDALNEIGHENDDGRKRRELPKFAHVGLIFKDGKKMSKRDGAASLLDYRDKGYDPDAIFNFLLRMGWGPKRDDASSTFMTREIAKSIFLNGGNMRSANAGFDQHKLDFYNRRYKQMK
jgi:nondiscriminating glutamyl-tRNA synthetase